MKKKFNKKLWLPIIIVGSVLLVVILIIFIAGLGLYKYDWKNSFTNAVTSVVPYPAATVNGKIVKYSDWQEKVEQNKNNQNFYLQEKDVDLKSLDLPDDSTIAEETLEYLIKKKILKKIEKQNDITITQDEIDQAYQDLVSSNNKGGEEAVEESLEEIYGWSIDDFKQEVIYEYLVNQKLEEIFLTQENNELDDLAMARAEEVLDKIKQGDQEFSDLARMYSEDGFALFGGDIGYIGKGEMLSFYEDEAWNLEIGEVSDIIKTPKNYTSTGYYIIKVEDKTDKDGETQFKISHIFIETNLDKLLEKELQEASINRWIKNF